MWLALLFACSGTDPSTSQHSTPVDEALTECMASQCVDLGGVDAEVCQAEKCAERSPEWGLDAQRVQFEGNTVFVEGRVTHKAGGYGSVDVPRTEPVFVGVTAVTSAGEEIDLAVQTRFQAELSEPFMFSAEVGPDVQDVLFGVWDRKVEPCDVDRHGCRAFGFVLDGSLASWPPGLYTEAVRQRIPPTTLPLQVRNAGMPPAEAATHATTTDAALGKQLERFGSRVDSRPINLAGKSQPGVVVRYGHPHDRYLAGLVATALGAAPDSVVARPSGGDLFEVLLGSAEGTGVHACLVDHCAGGSGDELDACFEEHCS